MTKKVILLLVAVALAAALFAYRHLMDRGRLTTEAVYEGLERTVTGNELVSARDPAVVMRFGPEFEYLGGQKFILYGLADTEQHFFAELTAAGELRSLYWVQFEQYLPDTPYSYDYDSSPLRVDLDEYVFYTDTAAVHPDPRNRRPGTDGARVREFLQRAGLAYPDDFAYARLVYLTDESRRKELMIIFVEDLATYGVTAAEVSEGGVAHERWPEIENAHLERIRATLTLAPGR